MKYPREKIWDLFVKLHLYLVKVGQVKNCNLTTEVLKENTLVSFYIKKIKANIKIKINKLKHDENRWSIKAIPIEGPFQLIEAEWSLVK